MAATTPKGPLDLVASPGDEARAFSFYQAVRVLEAASAGRHPRVGASRDPAGDFVRFGQHVELVHLANDLRQCTVAGEADDPTYRIKACFTGLAGPFGPMPEWL